MEPISAIASIVGIVDAGTCLASYLKKRCNSYTNAPILLQDLAQDVELWVGWVAVLVSHLEQPNSGHRPKFTKDAGEWAKQTGAIFSEIEALVPGDRDMDRTFSRGRWEFVRNEKRLGLAQEKLKKKQFNFMFMEAMYRSLAPPHPATSSSRDPNAMCSAGGLGDVQGPLLLSGVDGSGKRFEVRMHLTAMPEISGRSAIDNDAHVVETTSRNKVTREIDGVQERRLIGLAQSPLFDSAVSGKARIDGGLAVVRDSVSRHRTRYYGGHTEDEGADLEIKEQNEARKAEYEVEELRRRVRTIGAMFLGSWQYGYFCPPLSQWFDDASESDDEYQDTYKPPSSGYGVEGVVSDRANPPPLLPSKRPGKGSSLGSGLPYRDGGVGHSSRSSSRSPVTGPRAHSGEERTKCDACHRTVCRSSPNAMNL
ncbi:hypothetical protein LTR95_003083 [Oleoguttula sp. CCFEE 5521]